MAAHTHDHSACCNCGAHPFSGLSTSRRNFLQAAGIAVGAMALTQVTAKSVLGAEAVPAPDPARVPITVKAILSYDAPTPRPQTSWRNWGGVHGDAAAKEEMARITGELEKIQATADFPVKFLPVSAVKNDKELAQVADLAEADAVVLYAAGGPQKVLMQLASSGKHVIFFLRHRSGPVYLWYEIMSPRFLHQHKDTLGVKGVDNSDVVVDSLDDLTWRLRSLCGLKNAMGAKIVAIGGPGGWSTKEAPDLAKAKWKLDISSVTYEELKPILKAALDNEALRKDAADRAAKYLADPSVKLETDKKYVENAFLLETVFKGLMGKAGAKNMTINNCMSAIMPISQTTACMALSLLNDQGYNAFCESDFVVIPAGLLLCGISGRPNFLNDPTYPHHGMITLAHCTSPRKLDGKKMEPCRILTHFESDYGAAPKVEMTKGTKVTNIIPDFAATRYVGLLGEIIDVPFLQICRSQIDIAYKVPDEKIALNMPGFHWMTVYGDYLKEAGYALKKIPIGWECLG